MSRKKILWLPSWYPNKTAPFNGDFIKRHAEAVSLYDDIQVIYVVKDTDGVITKDIHIEEFENEGLSEKIIYYYTQSSISSLVNKYFSEKKYRKLYKEAVSGYIKKSGTPELTHVHVGMKAGAIALWLKKEMKVPYIISEHWSGFLDEATDKISDQPFYIQSIWKKVIEASDGVSAVSKYLARAIEKKYKIDKVEIIPNVVDTRIFYPGANNSNACTFIHISGLEELKNVNQIIKAIFIVAKTYPDVMLSVFGSENSELKKLVKEMGLDKNIQFHREIPQDQLAGHLRQSMALILYSSYETFGCVIIEANACGIPVVVSDIPVFHETVAEGVNGVFAQVNNAEALAIKMIEILPNRSSFDNKIIAGESAKYSYEKIGQCFSGWYKKILKNN